MSGWGRTAGNGGPAYGRSPAWPWLMSGAAAGTLAAAGLAVPLYGAGGLNSDTMWSLAWGRQILEGHVPDLSIGPTPHPLSNGLGLIVAPLGASAEPTVLVLGYLSAGFLIYATCWVAFRAFGLATAVATGILVFALPLMLTVTTGAYVDVSYAALVILAVLLELGRRGRGTATLTVLAVAGLLRPEAWFLAGGYWLWLAAHRDEDGALVRNAALVAAAPVIWVLADLILTRDPAFSLTHTTGATSTAGLPTGPSALVDLPITASNVLGRLTCVGALVGLVMALRLPRGRLLVGWLAATTLASSIPVLAGTPLNVRYFLPTFVLLLGFAAYGAVGWWTVELRNWRTLVGLACAVAVSGGLALKIGDLDDARAAQAAFMTQRDNAKAALTATEIACRPLVVPAQRARAYASVWTQVRLDHVLDAHDYQSRGTYLTGTASAMEGIVTIKGRPGTAADPPRDAALLSKSGGWELRERC
jgi:hypothetical protein